MGNVSLANVTIIQSKPDCLAKTIDAICCHYSEPKFINTTCFIFFLVQVDGKYREAKLKSSDCPSMQLSPSLSPRSINQ